MSSIGSFCFCISEEMNFGESSRISLLVEEESSHEEIDSETSASKQQAGGWKASSLIIIFELCMCITYYGISKNIVVYLKTELLEDNNAAAAHASTWIGTCFLTPLIGAYVSDSYLGNYLTIMSFGIINLIGVVGLTLSASVSISMHSPFFTFLALYLISLGDGSIKPCIIAFGADQFDKTDTRAKASFFSLYYLSARIGISFASTVIVWIEDKYGWVIGFGIIAMVACIALIGFRAGSGHYRYRKPSGSPFTRLCQVIVAASRKYNLNLPEDISLLYQAKGNSAIVQDNELKHIPEFSSFFHKAAIVTTSDVSSGTVNPWTLCTMSQVEELKSVLRLLPIWSTCILFSSVFCMESSIYIEQGMVMNRELSSLSIPAASLAIFSVLTVIIFAMIYDMIIVPVACKFTKTEGGLSHLQRAGTGLVFSILAVSTAAIVEAKRLQIAKDEGLVHETVAVPMSIFWQVPQYVLIAIGEVFNQIGMYEFFYEQAPDSMRSICLALALLTVSLGSYVLSFLLTVVNRITGWIPDNLNEGHLDRFFWLLAGLCFLNLVLFIYCASKYRNTRK